MIKVKNVNRISDNVCKCGSWYAHWRKFSLYGKIFCSESSCTENNLVGAHVQIANSMNKKWYIVPLCPTHIKSKASLDIGSTKLVSANKSLTCEK